MLEFLAVCRVVAYNGYMVQASYFLTGEELTRRVNVVKPGLSRPGR